MSCPHEPAEYLLRRLPDIPRWVEIRALLLRRECRVCLFRKTPLTAVVLGSRLPLAGVIGNPESRALSQCLEPLSQSLELIACREDAAVLEAKLTGWRSRPACLHILKDPARIADPRHPVSLLSPARCLEFAAARSVRAELAILSPDLPVAAMVVDGALVSHCSAGSVTETLWDVSVETLPGFRRSGYATDCFLRMAGHMRGLGKDPVWGSLVSNTGSLRLAASLGFEPCDDLVVFSRGSVEA